MGYLNLNTVIDRKLLVLCYPTQTSATRTKPDSIGTVLKNTPIDDGTHVETPILDSAIKQTRDSD